MDNIEDELKNFNIIDIKKLLPKTKNLIPNALLIFSIGMVIILLLLSVKYTGLKTISVMSSFYFTLHPCNSYDEFIAKSKKDKSCAGVPQKDIPSVINTNEKESIEAVMEDFKKDYCEKINIEDMEGMQPMLYVCRAAYLVSSNMSNIIIKGLYNILNFKGGAGVLILYVGMFLLLKFLREFIEQFIPTFAKSKKKKKSSFILDIIFSIFAIIAVFYVVCLIPTVLTYIMYLVYGFVFSDGAGSANVLRTMYFICIVIVPIALWLVGASLNITEGLTNKEKRKKEEKAAAARAAASGATTTSGSTTTSGATTTSGSTSRPASGSTNSSSRSGNSDVKCGDYNWIFFISFVLIIPFIAAMKQIPFIIISGINGMTCIAQDPNKGEILKKISFVSAYGIIIFIGMIFLPILLHMLRNIVKQIKFDFLEEFLDKLEDLTQIVK